MLDDLSIVRYSKEGYKGKGSYGVVLIKGI